MAVTIKSSDRMSNTSFHKRCSGNQKYWWLRGENGFVDLGGLYRGDYYFEEEVDVPDGTYTLGCGPRSHGVRETITIKDGVQV